MHDPDAVLVPDIVPVEPLLHEQSLPELDPDGLPLLEGHALHEVSVFVPYLYWPELQLGQDDPDTYDAAEHCSGVHDPDAVLVPDIVPVKPLLHEQSLPASQ